MKACSYLRCSGETQIKGDTWSRQSDAIAKYAKANGIEVVREFRDEGITGKMELENREGLSACIHFVRENGIGMVLVEDSTRLARDLIVAEVCIREFQKAGVRVVAAAGGVDLTEGSDQNPTAKLVRQILAAVSEFERCVITLKLRGAKARKKDPSSPQYDPDWHEGKRPYGYFPGEQRQIDEMQAMRSDGLTYQQIVDGLTHQGMLSRSGKPWQVGSVAKILTRS